MAPTPPSTPRKPKKHYSPHKRTRIAALFSAGVKAKAIAVLEGVPRLSVYKINARYKVQKSGKSLEGRGRHPKLTDRDKRHIMRIIDRDPFVSALELAVRTGFYVCPQTIINWLKSEGIQHYTALRRPKLTAKAAANRLKFARDHIGKPAEYWARWVFSDESTVARGEGERTQWVFCRKGERLHPEYVQPKTKPTRHSQMFWGAFGLRNRTALIDLHGNPDAERKGITGEVILATLQEALPTICEPGSIFAMDNAPTHTARVVMDWLREWAAENGVELVEWPPYSPDLNPIENLWKLLKERICNKRPELSDLPKNAKSKELLVRTAIEVWHEFESDLLEVLVLSMENRLQAVIDANGWYTDY